MQEQIEIMPSLIRSALNFGKRYIHRAISDILREWSMDDIIEDNWFGQ
ncbi:hypothetical protein [Candidatus Hodarchaeum mangrovi]